MRKAICVVYVERWEYQWRNSPPFMEAESSLPCSQQLTTGTYPEADESSSHFTN
jgi:hypothetical protein